MGLVALVFGTVRGNAEGWGAPAIVAAFTIGFAALAAFMAVELRSAAPALDLRLLRNGRLAAFVLAAFTLGAGLLSIFVALSAYQQGGLGASSMEAGLRFLPITVVYAITAGTVGRRLLARVDLVALLAAGMAAIAAGLLLMLLTGPSTSWTVMLPGFVLAGVGWGLANPAMVEGALAAVSPARPGWPAACSTSPGRPASPRAWPRWAAPSITRWPSAWPPAPQPSTRWRAARPPT
jgi:hypothetical protein